MKIKLEKSPKKVREERIKEVKQKKTKIMNEDIKEYLDLTNERLEGIYDLIKSLKD